MPLDDGPVLRWCVREYEEHLLLQFFRPLDDFSDLLGVSLLDKEVLDEEVEQAVFGHLRCGMLLSRACVHGSRDVLEGTLGWWSWH